MSFLGDLWGGFTGAIQKNAIREGTQQAQGTLAGGYNTSDNLYQTGTTNAMSRIAPFMQSGANTLYRNVLGINGRPAQSQAMSDFQSSPYMSYLQSQGQNAVDRRANAGGGYYSGSALRNASMVNQDIASRDYNDWQTRLAGLAGQEGQFAQYGSGLDMQNAANRAGLAYGNAQQNASLLTNQANALAQAAAVPWNNILGLGSMAVSAMTGMPVGKGGQTGNTFGNNMTNWGNQLYNNYQYNNTGMGYGMNSMSMMGPR